MVCTFLTLPDTAQQALNALLQEIRSCSVCAAHLSHAPRPVLRASAAARLLIVGQAPGRRVHETGIPWNDPSGDLLRQWLQLGREQFYDVSRIAIAPAGFCYPGTVRGGDLPPRRECAPLWHPRLIPLMPQLRLVLLVGRYAQAYYLGTGKERVADTVQAYAEHVQQGYFPLPHPSPRNRLWLKRNAWFELEVLPALRARVGTLLAVVQAAPIRAR